MFVVYKITNLINNKAYIGSSIRVKERWKQHINASKNPNNPTYNYPLYQAFRKYGVENFNFEILNDDFDCLEDMCNYEKNMIIYFNTCGQNGYNQTLETDQGLNAKENLQKYIKKISQACAKIDKNNNIIETYSSYHEAATKNNLDSDFYATKIRNVCKGINSSIQEKLFFRDLDKDGKIITIPFKTYRNKKPVIAINIEFPEEEQYYDSISSAAIALQTERKSISKCIAGDNRYSHVKGYILRQLDENGDIIENNISVAERIEQYNKTNPLINGERHNIKEWCSIYGISTNSFYKRIQKGMDVVTAITTPKAR